MNVTSGPITSRPILLKVLQDGLKDPSLEVQHNILESMYTLGKQGRPLATGVEALTNCNNSNLATFARLVLIQIEAPSEWFYRKGGEAFNAFIPRIWGGRIPFPF